MDSTDSDAAQVPVWSIRAGASEIYTGNEADCRGLYRDYKEWRGKRMLRGETGEFEAIPLQAATGLHPLTWNLPVELVDSTGVVKNFVDTPE